MDHDFLLHSMSHNLSPFILIRKFQIRPEALFQADFLCSFDLEDFSCFGCLLALWHSISGTSCICLTLVLNAAFSPRSPGSLGGGWYLETNQGTTIRDLSVAFEDIDAIKPSQGQCQGAYIQMYLHTHKHSYTCTCMSTFISISPFPYL